VSTSLSARRARLLLLDLRRRSRSTARLRGDRLEARVTVKGLEILVVGDRIGAPEPEVERLLQSAKRLLPVPLQRGDAGQVVDAGADERMICSGDAMLYVENFPERI